MENVLVDNHHGELDAAANLSESVFMLYLPAIQIFSKLLDFLYRVLHSNTSKLRTEDHIQKKEVISKFLDMEPGREDGMSSPGSVEQRASPTDSCQSRLDLTLNPEQAEAFKLSNSAEIQQPQAEGSDSGSGAASRES